MERMKTPNTRSEFEYRFHLLGNIIEQGRFHVNRGVSTDGLRRIRYLPNGRIDFLSVNEQARLTANMMVQMQRLNFSENINQNLNLDED
ncbi:AVAST type 1 anti-phage system protein Avs1c [Acinetobacter pittii]|uniref:AVAST type 1 anti-phage system protein Avs1c n=1 Tax=Acinetobacter pittii TaxID=48296 RepID=UPI0019520B98|nr:AVAST type 1 anti-phage system protein Avs1c [Acinetobacter pittii]QRQ11511.1 hypothetical protein I6J46_09830 [Acinetobacter pittii]